MSNQLPTITLTNNAPYELVLPPGWPLERISWIRLLNESPFTVNINAGGMNEPIPAFDDFPISIYKNVSGLWKNESNITTPIMLTPVMLSTNNITNISVNLIATLYALGETPNNTVPRSLARQTWVPNVVNNVSGVASSIVNDGNVNGTSVVEATPFGSASSELTIDNNGNAFFHGNMEVHGGIIANAVTTEALNDFALNILAGQNFFASVSGTGRVMEVNASGISLLAGVFNLLTGSLSRVAISGPFTTTSTASTVSHLLGAVPDFVIPWLAFSSAASTALSINKATITSTTVDLRSNITLSPVYLLSIKL